MTSVHEDRINGAEISRVSEPGKARISRVFHAPDGSREARGYLVRRRCSLDSRAYRWIARG